MRGAGGASSNGVPPLGHGLVSSEAQLEYQDFTREIEAIPANERVKRVLDEHLWDRRRKPR